MALSLFRLETLQQEVQQLLAVRFEWTWCKDASFWHRSKFSYSWTKSCTSGYGIIYIYILYVQNITHYAHETTKLQWRQTIPRSYPKSIHPNISPLELFTPIERWLVWAAGRVIQRDWVGNPQMSEIESCRKPSCHPKSSLVESDHDCHLWIKKGMMSEMFWRSIFPMTSRRGPFKPGDVRANPVGSPWDWSRDDFGKSRVAKGDFGDWAGDFWELCQFVISNRSFLMFFFECILGCGWYRSDELARAPRFVGLFMFRTSGKATHVLATNGTKAADTKKWERYTSETNRYGMMIWHDILIFSMMYEGITKI